MIIRVKLVKRISNEGATVSKVRAMMMVTLVLGLLRLPPRLTETVPPLEPAGAGWGRRALRFRRRLGCDRCPRRRARAVLRVATQVRGVGGSFVRAGPAGDRRGCGRGAGGWICQRTPRCRQRGKGKCGGKDEHRNQEERQ